MLILMAATYSSERVQSEMRRERDMGQSLEEASRKLPRVLSQRSHTGRTRLVLPTANCDNTCEIFSIRKLIRAPVPRIFIGR